MDRDCARAEFSASDSPRVDLKIEPEQPHWVAELFPPHFSFFDLFERCDVGPWRQEPCAPLQVGSEKDRMERSRRVQEIYRSALQEAQLMENQQRKKRMLKLIVREVKSEVTDPKQSGPEDAAASISEGKERVKEDEQDGGRCIWNEQDIAELRLAVREVELDRRRLRAELKQAQAEAVKKRQECRELQELLDQCEKQLSLANRASTQQALQLDTLRAEGRGRDAQLKQWTTEARVRHEEAQRAEARMEKAEEEVRQARKENSNLSWELERLKDQQVTEGRRLAEVARVERMAALQRLQREAQAAKAELEAERRSHARSRAALELLRRHFTGHPSQEPRESYTNQISYM